MSVLSSHSSVVSSVDVLNDAKEDVYLAQDGSATSHLAGLQQSDVMFDIDRLSTTLSTISRDGAGTAHTIRSAQSQPREHFMAAHQLRKIFSATMPSRSLDKREEGTRSASSYRPLFPPSRSTEGTLGLDDSEATSVKMDPHAHRHHYEEPSWNPPAVSISSSSSQFYRYRSSEKNTSSTLKDDGVRMASVISQGSNGTAGSLAHAHLVDSVNLALKSIATQLSKNAIILGGEGKGESPSDDGRTVVLAAISPVANQVTTSVGTPFALAGLNEKNYSVQALAEVNLARGRITLENERLFGPYKSTAEAMERLLARNAVEREITGFISRAGMVPIRPLPHSAGVGPSTGNAGMPPVQPVKQSLSLASKSSASTTAQSNASHAPLNSTNLFSQSQKKEGKVTEQRLREVSQEALARLERLRNKVNAVSDNF